MEITKLEVRKDKNNNDYLVIKYEARSGKECTCVLTHYNLEHCIRENVRYKKGK